MNVQPVVVHCPTAEVCFVKLGDGRLHYLKGTELPRDRQIIFVSLDDAVDVEGMPVPPPLWWERLASLFS